MKNMGGYQGKGWKMACCQNGLAVWELKPESSRSMGCVFHVLFVWPGEKTSVICELVKGHQHTPFSNWGYTVRISLGCFTLPTSCETHTCFSLDLPVSSLLWARDWADSTWTSVLPCCPSYVRSSYLLLTSIPTAEWEIT